MWQKQTIEIPYHQGLHEKLHPRVYAIVEQTNFFRMNQGMSEYAPKPAMDAAKVSVAFLPSCPLEEEVPTVSIIGSTIRYIPYRFPHYYTDVRGSFEDYLKSNLSKNNRKKLKKRINAFQKHCGHEIVVKEYRNPDEVEYFYQEARKLSKMSYQEQWLGLGLPDNEEFLEDMKRLAKHGEMRGFLLFAQEEPVAYLYGPIENKDILVLAYGCYHPDYKDFSVGSLLDYFAIKQCFLDDGIKTIDLTQGEGEHKQRFSTDKKDCGDVYFMNPTLTNLSIVASHWSFQRSYQFGRDFLKRHQLDARVRRFLRGS